MDVFPLIMLFAVADSFFAFSGVLLPLFGCGTTNSHTGVHVLVTQFLGGRCEYTSHIQYPQAVAARPR